jgi:hypothetical protein
MVFHLLIGRVDIKNPQDAIKGLAPAILGKKKYIYVSTFVFDGENMNDLKKALKSHDKHSFINGSDFQTRDKNRWKETITDLFGV